MTLRQLAAFARGDRVKIALGLGIAMVVIVLSCIPYLPLQDIPQQSKMLAQQRELHPGQVTEYYRVRTGLVFGYQLYCWIDRLLAPLLTPDQSLRALFIVAFLLLPLAVWRLARATGADPALATLLALPLGLSGHFKLGLVSYALGIPCALLALAQAFEISAAVRLRSALALCLWLTLAQLSHPVAFLIAGLMVFLVWLYRARKQPYATIAIVGAALPALLMLIHDARAEAYRNIPGFGFVWPVPLVTMQNLEHVFFGYFFLSYGIAGPLSLAGHLPLLVGTAACAALALQKPVGERWIRHALIWMIVLVSLPDVIAPRSLGTTFELATRFPLVACLLFTILGGQARARLSARVLGAVGAATLLAVGVSSAELLRHSLAIRAMIGDHPPRVLDGRVLPVRFNPCGHLASERAKSWHTYDPYWHIWAYALKNNAVSPQSFAFSGYHLVQLRSELYPQLAGIPDWLGLSSWVPEQSCAENNRLRLLWSLGVEQYDTVLAINLPEELRRSLDGTGLRVERISPGFTAIRKASAAGGAPGDAHTEAGLPARGSLRPTASAPSSTTPLR